MSKATETYGATLDGMRAILFEQTRLIDLWLGMFKLHQDGGGVFNVETDAYYQANASGRFVWETVQEGVDTANTSRRSSRVRHR